MREPLVERCARFPAECLQLRRIERVTAVVPFAVADTSQRRAISIRQDEESLGDVDVLVLVAAADVVDLAGLPLTKHELDARAVILDVQPVADLLAVAVERKLLAVKRVRHEERDE